ncbi:MAG: tetratricopeptide (TPR) repeat protein [Planctomycetota bacterium]
MSQTPLEETDTVETYSSAWGAVAWLLRQGQTWSGNERNGAFLGRGDGTFVESGGVLGLDQIADGRSVVRVDWDGDGDLDILLRSRTQPRLMYLENRLPMRGRSVQFKLVGRDSKHPEIGARLTVRGPAEEDPIWIRTRRAGEGYLAQSSAWLHVGVGDLPEVLVEVRWPDGEVNLYGTIAGGSSHVLVQGETEAREWIRPASDRVAGDAGLRPAAGNSNSAAEGFMEGRVVLAAPLPLPHIPVKTVSGNTAVLGGVAESLHGQNRSPMILLLWSPDCAPCLKELAAWSEARGQLENSGLSVLALQLIVDGDPNPHSDWLDNIQWPYARGSCSQATARIFAALASQVMGSTRPLALPMAFLVDQRGQLQVLYRGGVEADQVLKDTSIFALQGPQRLRASFPFDGLYLAPYKQPDWVLIARSFRAGGLPEVAKEYELALVRTAALDSAESQFEFGQARLRQRNFVLAIQHFEEAVQAGPGVIRYLEALAVCQYQLGQFERARDSFYAVLELDSRNENTLYNLGFLAVRDQEFESARSLLQRLRPLNQDLAQRLREALKKAEAEANSSERDGGSEPFGEVETTPIATPENGSTSGSEEPKSEEPK